MRLSFHGWLAILSVVVICGHMNAQRLVLRRWRVPPTMVEKLSERSLNQFHPNSTRFNWYVHPGIAQQHGTEWSTKKFIDDLLDLYDAADRLRLPCEDRDKERTKSLWSLKSPCPSPPSGRNVQQVLGYRPHIIHSESPFPCPAPSPFGLRSPLEWSYPGCVAASRTSRPISLP